MAEREVVPWTQIDVVIFDTTPFKTISHSLSDKIARRREITEER